MHSSSFARTRAAQASQVFLRMYSDRAGRSSGYPPWTMRLINATASSADLNVATNPSSEHASRIQVERIGLSVAR